MHYRGYVGRVSSRVFRKRDEITVMPSGLISKIKSVDTITGELEEAFVPMSISMTLDDDIDIGRGGMVVRSDNTPEPLQDIEVMCCCLRNNPSRPGAKHTIHQAFNEQKAMIKEMVSKIDTNTLNGASENTELQMNDICKIRLRATKPQKENSYRQNKNTGGIMVIYDATNATVTAGMVI